MIKIKEIGKKSLDVSKLMFDVDADVLYYGDTIHHVEHYSTRYVYFINGYVVKVEICYGIDYKSENQNPSEKLIYDNLFEQDKRYFPKLYYMGNINYFNMECVCAVNSYPTVTATIHEKIDIDRSKLASRYFINKLTELSKRYDFGDILPDDREDDSTHEDANYCITKKGNLKILDYGIV